MIYSYYVSLFYLHRVCPLLGCHDVDCLDAPDDPHLDATSPSSTGSGSHLQ